MNEPIKFEWRGNHHLYHGVWLIGFGLFNWYMSINNSELETLIPVWKALITVGVFMIIDDVIEHNITSDTPLRIFYIKVVRPFLRRF